jgi:hypothetical protein
MRRDEGEDGGERGDDRDDQDAGAKRSFRA